MKGLRALLVCGLTVSALTTSAAVSADSTTAEALFEQGVALEEHGDLRRACQKFEASENVDVAVGTLLRMADCYEKTGRLASAWSRFREAASLAQAQAMPERRRIAQVRADALEPRMAHVVIHAPLNPPPGFRVTRDGAAVPQASFGSELPADAGSSLIEASAPGYSTLRRQLVVPLVNGAHVDVALPALDPEPTTDVIPVRLRRAPVPEPAPVTVGTTRRRGNAADRGYAARTAGVTLGVLGGAGLLTGGVLAIEARRRSSQALAHCPNDPTPCTPRGVEQRRESENLATGATVSAAVGGGLLATGLLVYVFAPSNDAREQVGLGIVPDPRGGVSLQAKGAF